MNIKLMVNFLLVLSIVWAIVFFYKNDIEVIEKKGYVDLSNRLVGNNELENIEEYINKNNITHIKVNAKNLDLNRIAELELQHPENITFHIINSKDLNNNIIWGYLFKYYKQIILTDNFEQRISQILTVNGEDYSIFISDDVTDADIFQLLFKLKNKKIKKLKITWLSKLQNFPIFKDQFFEFKNIDNIYLYDDLDFYTYITFHDIAIWKGKKLFFSSKPEIEKLNNLKNKPKDLLLDNIPWGLDIKDILDIHTIFWNHEFDLLSLKQKFNPNAEYSLNSNFNTREIYKINIEILNKYIHYKKANLVWNKVVFNTWFDICSEKKILLLSSIQSLKNTCWLNTFHYSPKIEWIDYNIQQVLFIKNIFDFMIEKKLSDFPDLLVNQDVIFEEFWLFYNTKERSYLNDKKITIEDIDIFATSSSILDLNYKEQIKKYFIWYIEYFIKVEPFNIFFDKFMKYKNYSRYNNIFITNFQWKEWGEIKYLNMFLLWIEGFTTESIWEKQSESIDFYQVIDNIKNNWVLIFYTHKDE